MVRKILWAVGFIGIILIIVVLFLPKYPQEFSTCFDTANEALQKEIGNVSETNFSKQESCEKIRDRIETLNSCLQKTQDTVHYPSFITTWLFGKNLTEINRNYERSCHDLSSIKALL